MCSSKAIRTRRRSSGFVLAFVLICLTIIILVLTAMTQRVVFGQRQVRQRERQLQAQWLVEAGLSRAAAKLQHDPQYAGEHWQLPAAEIGDRWTARVEIAITPLDQPERHRIQVVAVYPDQGRLSIREENSVVVQIPSEAISP